MTAGNDYYIVVDGWGGDMGEYNFKCLKEATQATQKVGIWMLWQLIQITIFEAKKHWRLRRKSGEHRGS